MITNTNILLNIQNNTTSNQTVKLFNAAYNNTSNETLKYLWTIIFNDVDSTFTLPYRLIGETLWQEATDLQWQSPYSLITSLNALNLGTFYGGQDEENYIVYVFSNIYEFGALVQVLV